MKKIILLSLFMPIYLASQITVVASGASTNQVNLNSVYTQNFNSLINAAGITWTNNSNLYGCYANSESLSANVFFFDANNGSSSAGKFYNYGGLTSSDRSLGYIGSSSNTYTNIFFRFINNSGSTITSITVGYTGEQWRSGGNGSDNNNTFTFNYNIVSTNITSNLPTIGTNGYSTGWVNVPSLTFTPPNKTAAAGLLDGNLATNRTVFSPINITGLNWQNGSELWIRFTGNDGLGTDAGISIDDFTFQPSISCSPPTITTTATGLTEQCTDATNQFTYYGNATNPSQFAIKKNGNTISATVDITRNSSIIPSTSTNGTNKEHGSYLMGSSWDVTTSSTITNPVTVRFYYAPADTLAAMTARDNAYNTLLTTNSSTLAIKSNSIEWFKTVGVPYNSSWTSTIVGNKFPSSHIKLTPTYGVENGVNYVEFSGITSFSGGTGGYSFGEANASSVSSLPILWGKIWINEDKFQLNWETLSELNTNYFEVEASEDAIHFNTISEKIPAKGVSQSILNYKYNLGTNASLYYRIKEVDLDKSYNYSKIIHNSIDRKNSLIKPIRVIYNDKHEFKELVLNNSSNKNITVLISNTSGQVKYTSIIESNSSKSILSSDLNLLDGMYFVTIPEESYHDKIMIKK